MNIFVFPDIVRGEVKDISFEMLGLAKKLAQTTGGRVHTLLLGKNVGPLAHRFGASDVVIKVDHEQLEHFNPHVYRQTLLLMLRDYDPDLILFGHTSIGMDLAGFLATKLAMPLLAFCTHLEVTPDGLTATSLVCGGKAYARCRLQGNKGVVLMTSGAYPADEGKIERAPAVEEASYAEVTTDIRFEGYIEPEVGDIDITKEDVLVGVGRGIQDVDNIALAEELADELEAALAATRPVIEQGWLPLTRQVGRSGKMVKPKLYLALGMSGAPEHVEGMKDSELIIAVNTDPEAPIFNVADYGVVGDALEIIALLTEEVRKHKETVA